MLIVISWNKIPVLTNKGEALINHRIACVWCILIIWAMVHSVAELNMTKGT